MTGKTANSCGKKFCQGFFVPRGEKFTRKVLKGINGKKAKTFKYSNKQKKELEKTCKLHYCNPTCKGTIFQRGKAMPILEETKQLKGKQKKFMNDIAKQIRKEYFKGKTNVLKHGFYEKLPAKTRKLIQEKGATSGCAAIVIGV